MATIRKRKRKWQVLIRRQGLSISRSFITIKDAQAWARHMEAKADRGDLPPDPKVLQRITLGELVSRYRDTVTPNKRTANIERIVLNAFLRRSICAKRLSELRTVDFVAYRDERLKDIKPSSLARELTPVRHMFEVARKEWGLAGFSVHQLVQLPGSGVARAQWVKTHWSDFTPPTESKVEKSLKMAQLMQFLDPTSAKWGCPIGQFFTSQVRRLARSLG